MVLGNEVIHNEGGGNYRVDVFHYDWLLMFIWLDSLIRVRNKRATFHLNVKKVGHGVWLKVGSSVCVFV